MTDKAGEKYWTQVWENLPLPPPMKIISNNVNHYPDKIFHKCFSEIFSEGIAGKKLLEIGCGNSVILPYLARQFKCEVTGIDYSELGCMQSREILRRDGVDGEILCIDAFNPDPSLLNKFDVVCSFGVVEHFEDTAATLRSFSKFLKPGGILVTSVPNMVGLTGLLQKHLNKPIYDIHVPMDRKYIQNALESAGLKPYFNKYFLAISFAPTLEGIDGKPIRFYLAKKIFVKTIRYASKIIWMVENILGPLPSGKMFSAGIMTAARKV